MSLARAFTTRRAREGSDLGPQRSNTTKGSMSLRNKISGPVELVHTTNMLSYNAPDLPRSKHYGLPSVSISSKSEDDSDTLNTLDSTPPTSPDVAPGERSGSPDASHLSTYFMAPLKPMPAPPAAAPSQAPAIPKRSPSHTKKASIDNVTRQQSLSRASKASDQSLSSKGSMSFSSSRSSSTSTSTSHLSIHSRKLSAPPRPAMTLSPTGLPTSPKPNMPHSPNALPTSPRPRMPPSPSAMPMNPSKDAHPFGQELAQVTELVEELNIKPAAKTAEVAEDDKYLASKGLVKFSIDDYMSIVEDLATNFFPDTSHIRAAGPMWI